MRHRLGFFTALLALVLLGVAAQSSLAFAASPGWVDAETLSPFARAESAQTAIDADGNALAVWASNGVMVSTRSPGAAGWSTPQQISTDTLVGELSLAANTSGEAVISWLGFDDTPVVHAVTRDAAGSFSAELTLDAPSEGLVAPGVAIDSSGNAVVAWTVQAGVSPAVKVATRPAGGEFTLADPIPVAGDYAIEVAPAVVDAGEVLLTWTEGDGSASIIKMATGSIGATTFSAPVDLSAADASAGGPVIAVDGNGDAAIAWTFDEFDAWSVQSTARAGADGGFSTPVQISPGNGWEADPSIAMDADGEATIAWSAEQPEPLIEAATWSPADGYSDVEKLSVAGAQAVNPVVAANAGGDTLVSWQAGSGFTGTIQAADRIDGAAAFAAPVTLSAPGRVQLPAVAIAPDGNGVSVWTYTPPGLPAAAKGPRTNAPPPTGAIQAAGFSATPPQLTDVFIPTIGTAGQPLPFLAKPVDVWTREPATEFSFGDGSSATGTAFAHTYGTPGTYSVKVTATNARGFTTSELASVKIEAASTNAKEKPKDELITAKQKAKVAIALKAAKTLPISAGAVVLKIENKGNRAVSGTLKLWTTAHLKAKVPSSIGEHAYKVKPGKSVTLTIALSDEALRLIGRKANHRLAVKATASFQAADGNGGKVSRKVKLQG